MTTSPSARLRFASVALLATFLAVAGLRAQIVLDDFSTDTFATHYVQKNVSGFSPGGWNVASGQLQPDSITTAGGYAAFAWTQNSLQNVGDWFSMDISVASTGGDHNGGLSIWTSNSTTFDRVIEPRLGYNGGYAFVGSDQNSQLWVNNLTDGVVTGAVTLKVTLSNRDTANDYLTITLSQNGSLLDTEQYTVSGFTGSLYAGPSAWQASGGNVAFDNLTYSTSAIPEPSTYAALFGVAALSLAVWHRRRRATA